jgi:hypothetical protein
MERPFCRGRPFPQTLPRGDISSVLSQVALSGPNSIRPPTELKKRLSSA